MKVGLAALNDLLRSNVCDIRFGRRRNKVGFAATRRMICTLDMSLLQSIEGRTTLNYRPVQRSLPWNPASKNLLNVWDILMQDYRNVNMDACEVVEQIPSADFWQYFNDRLATMSPANKLGFMNT